MLELRDYQKPAVAEIREALAKYRRVLFQAQTGYGKSSVFTYIAIAAQKYNRKVLILSDRTEILKQNGGTIQRSGAEVDYISPKHRDVPSRNIVVAMAQTVNRRVSKSEWAAYLKSVELLIIDECHNQTADFVFDYINDRCFVLGCTATPRRYGKQRQLGELYRAMVQGVSTQELIDKGWLSSCRLYSVAAPKLDIPIDYGTGDYNKKALAQAFEHRPLYQGVVREWLRLAPHTKTICFCCSSLQAIETCKEFIANGISARYVLSGEFDEDETYSGARKDIYDAFARGEFEVLVNVNILTAGFDAPDVQTIIVDFATVSVARWRQAIGRGCRVTAGKKEFVVLDCGANWKKHGGFADEVQWLLWHDSHSGGGVQGVKTCCTDKMDINHRFGCGQLVPVSCKVCPACGYVFLNEKYEYELYLEEVANTERGTVRQFCAEKKREGWSFYRILMQVALANTDNVKPAIIEAYLTFHPEKTREDAGRFYYVWKKNSWDKHRHKVKPKQVKEDAGLFG